ncbi:MAG TPA: ABC transporter substrate-binding protein [Acidimicrobiales bacterium]|nr:ABC transporter substrate-binding protein [Acidimicrobiales bacterium]
MFKTRFRWLIAVLAVFSLFAAACGDDSSDTASTGGGDEPSAPVDGPTIKIGAQDFGESKILGEIYKQALEAKGFTVELVEIGGFRDILLEAFASDEVNFSAEYAASMLEFLNENAGEATGDADETVELLQAQLDDLELTALDPAPAVDTNAFVITDETAADLGYEKLSDLPADGEGLTLGAPADCETNPFCIPGLDRVYGVDLTGGFTPLDAGLVADSLAADAVNIGVLFSTSAKIADEGWVLLEDDQNMLAADNITPVVSNAVAEAYGDDMVALVNQVSAALDTDTLTALNKRFDIDKEDADAIAADFVAGLNL